MDTGEEEAPVLTHEDNQAFLQLLRDNREMLGMGSGKVEVRFEEVSVVADVRAAAHRALPTLLNTAVNAAQDVAAILPVCTKSKGHMKIIDGASGTIRSSRMTLVLGAPGSGKTTFLRALAGKLDPSLKATTFRDKTDLAANYIIKILGLSECADTIIGDDLRRGISGGQKKRATIGEMLVSFSKCFFMDDISTGLDSSTTFDIMKFLQQMTRSLELTMVISLLQPPPETFELFDDVILLCEGQIVYHGPRENVTDFFGGIGFKCPSRKNIADFLQEVTSNMDQKQYWVGNESEYQYHAIEKFVESFHTSFLPQIREGNLQKQESNKIIKTSKHVSVWSIFHACFSRELLLVKRNYPLHMFKAIQIIILAFVTSTLFLRTEENHNSIKGANKYMGALFLAIVVPNFNGMTELGMTIRRMPTFYKQRELLALPGWALLSSIYLINLPLSLVETSLWSCLTYYAIGYAPSPIRFFQQLMVVFSMHQMSMGLYRLLASIGRTQVLSNMLGITVLISIYILGGYVISIDKLQTWLRWGHWASPFTYAQNAISLNEFLDKRWGKEFHYENANTIGEAILKIRGLFIEWQWYWICLSVLFGFSVVFNILTIFALEFLNPPYKQKVSIINSKKVQMDYNNKTSGDSKVSTNQVKFPFQPLSLAFSHINYFVDMPKEMKKYGIHEKRLQLLRDVSGAFRPGVLTALMGITGAGKTTLLDVLAGRKTGGYIEGTVKISGYPKKQKTFTRVSGYCEQTDIHSPNLTIYESLQYAAWLRLPSHVKSCERAMFIKEVMDLVELTGLMNAMVGLPGATGLSAEQRKRLTIAVELLAGPSIIFMDEPTTGLDARAAAIVMRTVRRTVNTGRTVVCTIHQPSIEIFESFDEVCILILEN
uniref:ABC transporter domain-containing protein n=1 Tax=Oryza brachyantha TaxID=4533 RepID=J3MUY2_ORYBR